MHGSCEPQATGATAAEPFGLSWPGRRAAELEAERPPHGGLAPTPRESLRPEVARHAFVEGENLEVLRLLVPAYEGRAKLVYLDPPYNTGELMTFADDFRDPAAGADDPRAARHAGWLSMMLPRLALARRLLTTDGVLLVSIDDHEVHHLRALCDELFGPDRLLGTFVWRRRSGAMDATDNVSCDHEYVVAYARGRARLAGEARDFARYRNPDGDPRGDWIADNLSASKPGGDTWYPITDPETGFEYWPPRGRYWPYNPETMAAKIADGRVLFPGTRGGSPMLKRFRAEARRAHRPVSTWIAAPREEVGGDEVVTLRSGPTTEGTRALKRLLGEAFFRYPKPVSLLRGLVLQATAGDDLVVDAFAGSGTIAQAVLEANASDGGARRFLCVQRAEPLAGEGPYATIADVARERIRRLLRDLPDEGLATFRLCAPGDPARDRDREAALGAGTPLIP